MTSNTQEQELPLRGSCLCGDIKLEVSTPIKEVVCCYCSKCRKNSGTAYATNAPIPASSVTITQGKDKLTVFESSPGKFRHFCSRCGSPIYSRAEAKPEVVRLRIGCIDTKFKCKVAYRFFTASAADWVTVPEGDGVPNYPDAVPANVAL